MDVREMWALFWATPVGAATGAFLRVFVATATATWMQAGLPIYDLTLPELAKFVELGLQAGASLVILNYFGPWEQRYGREQKVKARRGES
jgi:fluoride ion exporter CrcB/FEX